MLWFFTAIQPEAVPVLKTFSMEREPSLFGTFYRSKEAVLVISGSGPVSMAAAAAEALSRFPAGPADIAVNLGICGAPAGYPYAQCYRIHKITDASSGRDFYPDLLAASDFGEAALTTHSVPCASPATLADMEGSAFFETVAKAFSPDRIFLYKIVSDHGIEADKAAPSLTPQNVTELIENAFGGILKEVTAYTALLPEEPALSRETEAGAEALCTLLDASVTMRNDIRKMLLYLQLRDGNAAEAVRRFLLTEGLDGQKPLRRKEGKLVLERFRQYCLL